MVALAAGVPTARAQVFALNALDREEMRRWGVLFWHYMETGHVHADATGFRFTNPHLHHPLTSPVRRAVMDLSSVFDGAPPAIDCSMDSNACIGSLPWTDVRDWMICASITTNAATEAERTQAHLLSLLASIPGSVSVTLRGDSLESNWEESPSPLPGPSVLPASPASIGEAELAVVGWIAQRSPSIAASMDRSGARAYDRLLGRDTYWEEFGARFHRELVVRAGPVPTQVRLLEPAWEGGLFSLVVLQVEVGRAFVLVDPLSGEMIGPFEPESAIDARPLLASYPQQYQAGQPVFYFDENGVPREQLQEPEALAWPACLGCVIGMTASCAILCADQPWWTQPDEGFHMCMVRCIAEALGMTIDVLQAILNNQPIDPAGVVIMACVRVCGDPAVRARLIKWLRKYLLGPKRGYLKPHPGWTPTRQLPCTIP